MRTVHGFVAACRPARAPGQRTAVVTSANKDNSGCGLLLEVAFEAEGGVALHQHFAVDRAVNRVARRAAFTHRLMLENERPALRGMTLAAGLALHRRRKRSAESRVPLVRVVAVAAGHFPFHHRMMVRQVELASFVEMALEASLRILTGVDNGAVAAATLVMQAAGAVARFTAHVMKVWPFGLQASVSGGGKIAMDLGVALRTRG